MKQLNVKDNRRSFLKTLSISTIPLMLPFCGESEEEVAASNENQLNKIPKHGPVNFIFDGLSMSPSDCLRLLQKINTHKDIQRDAYGKGGVIKVLEDKFVELTGKEKAIYLPTGTMANQLAIKLLNENKTKVIVPDNSHVFRDEGDAAQSVHNKRLIPIGKEKAFFDLNDLKDAIQYLDKNEIFKSGLGTIVLESPIRRADGIAIPIDIIKEISAFCKQNGYKMHLDGARLHLACAYANVSLLEYSSYFDTVYISLYKYLNAHGGAILCGEAELIDQIRHQIKIHGGTIYQNWISGAIALHFLEGINERWQQVISVTAKLITALNKLNGVQVKSINNGTNIYDMWLAEEISLKKLANYLYTEHNIWLAGTSKDNIVKFTVNESILTRNLEEIIMAWETGIEKARVGK